MKNIWKGKSKEEMDYKKGKLNLKIKAMEEEGGGEQGENWQKGKT